MSLSPPEYIRHILDEIDYIMGQVSITDYESFIRYETLADLLSRYPELRAVFGKLETPSPSNF